MASDVDVRNAGQYDQDVSTEFQDLLVSSYGKKSWNIGSSQSKISRSEIFTSKMSNTWRNELAMNRVTPGEHIQQQLMDPNTPKWKAWAGNSTHYASQEFDNNVMKPEMNKLTKAEFRKLTEQVREVNETMSKYRTGNGFRNLSNGLNSTPVVYRTQLARSLKAFQPKQWKSYDTSNFDHSYKRCRPVSCVVDHSSNARDRPITPTVRRGRPKSSPVTHTHTVMNNGVYSVYADQFDRLTPSVVYELTNGDSPRRSYGEKSAVMVAGAVGTGCSPSATSSGETLDDNDIIVRDSQQPTADTSADSIKTRNAHRTKMSTRRTPARTAPRRTSSHGSVGTDTSDTERSLDPINDIIFGGKFQVPKTEYMRPEKLDDLYVPDGKKDRKKYDFDATIVHEVEYGFKNPLPPQLRTVDFRDLAEMGILWRDGTKKRPTRDTDSLFVDRVFDMELLQVESEDWEKARHGRLKRLQKQQQVSIFDLIKGVPPDHRPKDRKCLADCVQAACVGDCPEKNIAPEVCIMCRQKLCVGSCSETGYEGYARTASKAPENTNGKQTKRSRSCTPCASRHNAKLINANSLVLGRPRSGFATYERGSKSAPQKDLRPKSAASVSSSVANEFRKLNLTTYRPASGRPKTSRLRGRAASSPGKSYFSQRRYSLTDHSVPKRPQSAAPVTLRKRAKSATKRVRPKTAHT